MLTTKKQQAIDLIKSKDYKKALKIMSTFRREFSKDQLRHFQIAKETISDVSRQVFYASIGVDWKSSINISKQLMRTYAE